MTAAAWKWIAWAVAAAAGFVMLEGSALRRGVLEDTLTYQLKAVMLVHPWLLVLVPTVIVAAGVGLALHLVIEALKP